MADEVILDLTTPAKIEELMINHRPGVADTEFGRNTLEAHIPLFLGNPLDINSSSLLIKTIDPGQAALFEGDFIGLLRYLRVDIKYDWINTRINGLNDPTEYDGVTTQVFILSDEAYERVANQIMTQMKRKV